MLLFSCTVRAHHRHRWRRSAWLTGPKIRRSQASLIWLAERRKSLVGRPTGGKGISLDSRPTKVSLPPLAHYYDPHTNGMGAKRDAAHTYLAPHDNRSPDWSLSCNIQPEPIVRHMWPVASDLPGIVRRPTARCGVSNSGANKPETATILSEIMQLSLLDTDPPRPRLLSHHLAASTFSALTDSRDSNMMLMMIDSRSVGMASLGKYFGREGKSLRKVAPMLETNSKSSSSSIPLTTSTFFRGLGRKLRMQLAYLSHED